MVMDLICRIRINSTPVSPDFSIPYNFHFLSKDNKFFLIPKETDQLEEKFKT